MFSRYKFLKDNRNALKLFSANSLQMIGSWIRVSAFLVFFHQFEALELFATLLIAKQVIELFFQPIAGWLADYTCKKSLKIITQFGCMIIALAIAVLMTLSEPPLLLIVILSSVASAFSVIFSASAMAVTPVIVEEKHLPLFNSLMGSVSTFALTLGPALGGLVMIARGPEVVLLLDAVLFAGSLVLVARIDKVDLASQVKTTGIKLRPRLSDFVAGFRYTFSNTKIRALVFLGMASNAGVAATWILNPYINESYGYPQEWASYTMSVIGMGSFLGMTLGGLIPERHFIKSCLFGVIAFALSLASWGFDSSIVLLAWAPPFLMGFFACVHEASYWTLLQKETPQALFGRVFSAVDSLAVIGMIAGTALTDHLIDTQTLHSGVLGATVIMILLWLLGIASLVGSQLPESGTTMEASRV